MGWAVTICLEFGGLAKAGLQQTDGLQKQKKILGSTEVDDNKCKWTKTDFNPIKLTNYEIKTTERDEFSNQ